MQEYTANELNWPTFKSGKTSRRMRALASVWRGRRKGKKVEKRLRKQKGEKEKVGGGERERGGRERGGRERGGGEREHSPIGR